MDNWPCKAQFCLSYRPYIGLYSPHITTMVRFHFLVNLNHMKIWACDQYHIGLIGHSYELRTSQFSRTTYVISLCVWNCEIENVNLSSFVGESVAFVSSWLTFGVTVSLSCLRRRNSVEDDLHHDIFFFPSAIHTHTSHRTTFTLPYLLE